MGGNHMYYGEVQEKTSSVSMMTKVFGWMGLGLLVTAAVAVGIYFLLGLGIIPVTAYIPLLIAASVGYFILLFFINFRVLRGSSKSVVVPFMLYATTMGILLSTLMITFEIETLALAFGASALVFGMMALYGALTKRDLSLMGSMAFMFFFGAFVIGLINFFFFNETIYWIVSFVMFGAILLITAYDVWMIRRSIDSGIMTNNLAVYFALKLYVDFIFIFLRVVYFIALSRR
jgi:uncharacterized protein